jgi:hypothetical protein
MRLAAMVLTQVRHLQPYEHLSFSLIWHTKFGKPPPFRISTLLIHSISEVIGADVASQELMPSSCSIKDGAALLSTFCIDISKRISKRNVF